MRLEIFGNPENLEIKMRFLCQSIPIIRKLCNFTAIHEHKCQKLLLTNALLKEQGNFGIEIATVVPTEDCGADKHMLLVNLI